MMRVQECAQAALPLSQTCQPHVKPTRHILEGHSVKNYGYALCAQVRKSLAKIRNKLQTCKMEEVAEVGRGKGKDARYLHIHHHFKFFFTNDCNPKTRDILFELRPNQRFCNHFLQLFCNFSLEGCKFAALQQRVAKICNFLPKMWVWWTPASLKLNCGCHIPSTTSRGSTDTRSNPARESNWHSLCVHEGVKTCTP